MRRAHGARAFRANDFNGVLNGDLGTRPVFLKDEPTNKGEIKKKRKEKEKKRRKHVGEQEKRGKDERGRGKREEGRKVRRNCWTLV